MSRFPKPQCWIVLVVLILMGGPGGGRATAWGGVTGHEVEGAIREGVRFLKQQQRPEGSWLEVENRATTGTASSK